MRCAAITKAGERCRLDATHGSYCYQHSPETAAERRRAARRGGKAGGNGRGGVSELIEVKRQIRAVITDVLSGQLDKGVGAVAFQGYNTLLKAVEIERRVREIDDLATEVEELKREYGRTA